jgi:hypothetical protein
MFNCHVSYWFLSILSPLTISRSHSRYSESNMQIGKKKSASLCRDQGNSNPTAAHAGRTWQLKWVLGAWGFSWATLPGIYRYGGLALQFGGWATGWQPVAVKKLTDTKPKLWPRKSRTGWTRSRQWKRNNEMRIIDGGIVYKQILINTKLRIGKRSQ